jgi:hypothetical protein
LLDRIELRGSIDHQLGSQIVSFGLSPFSAW